MAALADLRYSLRSLTRAPGLALALLFTIALGIGSNASVLGFIHGLVARGLPLPGIDQIATVFQRDETDGYGPLAYDDYVRLKTHVAAFESLGAIRESRARVEVAGRSAMLSVAAATPEVSGLLPLLLGDGVVISDRLWRLDFNGVLPVRGRTISVDGIDARVAGIAPEWLDGLYAGRAVDLWLPLRESPEDLDRRSRTFWVLGRLRANATSDLAQAEANSVVIGATAVAVVPYTGITPEMASGMSRVRKLLPAAAGAVFFIACATVVGFLLSRASGRSHETSIRVALGARRSQLGQQLLADSAIISVCGGALGVLLAVWTAHIIPALFVNQDAEQLVFWPDVRSLAAASASCVAITIACGLVPLFEVRVVDPGTILRREGGGVSRAAARLRAGLVVSQMACCCLLLISTGLLLEGFRGALRTSLGDRLGQPVIARLEALAGFARPERGLSYFDKAEEAAMKLPGIFSTAWTSALPGGTPTWRPVRIEPRPTTARDVSMDVAALTPETLGRLTLPPAAGRMFGGGDTPGACRVVLVNEEAAAALFDGDAVGRSITDPAGQRVEIIGVVTLRTARAPAGRGRPTVLYYAEQAAPPFGQLGPARFQIPSRPTPLSTAVLDAHVVSASYFASVGVSPIAGHLFPRAGDPLGCRVAVINGEAAELYFGGDAVGGAVIDLAGRRTEIIGVVPAAVLRTAQRRAEPAIYFPMGQDYLARMTLIMSAREAPEPLLASVRHQLSLVEGGGPTPVVTTLEAYLARTALAPERISTILVGTCAAMALTLSVLGVYGAMADSVRRRRRELALRVALGAQAWRVIVQVLREGVRLAAIGASAGILGSFLVARWLARVAPGARASVWVWTAAPLMLAAVVAVASVIPARRALRVDPLTIMRDN